MFLSLVLLVSKQVLLVNVIELFYKNLLKNESFWCIIVSYGRTVFVQKRENYINIVQKYTSPQAVLYCRSFWISSIFFCFISTQDTDLFLQTLLKHISSIVDFNVTIHLSQVKHLHKYMQNQGHIIGFFFFSQQGGEERGFTLVTGNKNIQSLIPRNKAKPSASTVLGLQDYFSLGT